jgi:hypothetical protein
MKGIDFIKLKELGAVQVGEYLIAKRDYILGEGWGIRQEVFNKHYFNREGLEVAYFIPSFSERLHIFETPRVWDEGFKAELRITNLILN